MRGVRCIPVLVLLARCWQERCPRPGPGEARYRASCFTHDTHDHWYPTESEGEHMGIHLSGHPLLRQEREAFPSGEGQALVTLDAGTFPWGPCSRPSTPPTPPSCGPWGNAV